MKKLSLLILILPFLGLAQVDSLILKNQTIDEILKNRMPNGAIVENAVSEIIKINSLNIPEKQFPGTVCQASVRHYPKPNIVVNGELVSEEFLRNLDPNNIESVEIVKNGNLSHVNLNGTILIKTKDSNYEPTEYDLAVLDLAYDNFLKMQPSEGTYSLSYLQNRNQRYVSVWNQRTLTNPDIYEIQIDYDSENYYGLEFEYKLYMFFKFMEKKHSISMF